ncbi:MAG: VCBS repeat-containing protein [Verrucomicrobiota bacterium]
MTAIKALPGGGVLLADAATKRLQVLNSTGTPCAQLELGNVVSSIRVAGSNLIVSGLGSFVPSDDTDGGVYLLQWAAGGLTLAQRLLSNLPRTTDAFLADVDGNGTKDCVASLFGNNLGRFSWFGPRTDGTYAETVLFALPGALRSEWADVDRDGRPDLTVLVAQETEALLLFHNLGAGRFEQRVLFQRPPFWGHSYFESADFNRDGRPDFLVANGDNGEFVSPPKAVHGVRIYTAQDDSTWRETYFYPMHGAYKAIARDFDGDGDLDIAAISYFPDYRTAPRESFVLLLNQGDGRFRPFTFAESALGRWICMDVGDWDGDGADDILLGSCIKGPTAVPAKLMEAWKSARLPLVVLRHTSGPARATTKP